VIYRALPGGIDRIILYYYLMATWTGLGDNTELFWAVLSHYGPTGGDSQSSQENEEMIQQEFSDPQPRVCQSVQQDHPVDNILGSIRRGVTTHSRLANLCEHYLFVSMLEPLRVEEALGDAD
jgi:hypothetical protein